MAADAALLEARRLGKSFPGVVALDDVGLTVRRGEVVAVIGENGAGKSTLMKILAGVYEPDVGEILWEGVPVRIDSVRRAVDLGIALIHQELNLCGNLSAGANVFLGREPRRRFGAMRPREIDAAATPFLERVGLRVSPSMPASKLSIGQQQLVEIAKALSQDAQLLIMDEPTSSLSFDEASRLFGVIRELRSHGVTVVYITHRLHEVELLADRVVGLRDGRNSGELTRNRIEHRAMVRLMVGRDLEVRPRRRRSLDSPVRLAVRGLRTVARPAHPIDVEVRRGEIVGLAGLMGAGRSELLETIFGARRAHRAGSIEVDGVAVPPHDLRAAVDAGMALVPENRKEDGAVLSMTIRENITLASLPEHRGGALSRFGWLDARHERETVARALDRLDVRCSGAEQLVAQLSGGNQQKVVLSKWLARDCRVLLLDEPTRGVDIAAKDEIYQRMEELADQGLAVLFASSEMAEILGLADRILVLHEGRLSGELRGGDATEEQVMAHATGVPMEVEP